MQGDVPLSLFRFESATLDEMYDRKMVRPEGLSPEYEAGAVLNTGYGDPERTRFVVAKKDHLLAEDVDDDLAYSCGFRPGEGLTESEKFRRWLEKAYPGESLTRVVVYTLRRV